MTPSGEVVTEGKNGKGKKKNKKKSKKKEKEKLVELGPARPSTIAAPVSAVTRGTTPGLLPLAAVCIALLLTAVIGRRLVKRQTT